MRLKLVERLVPGLGTQGITPATRQGSPRGGWIGAGDHRSVPTRGRPQPSRRLALGHARLQRPAGGPLPVEHGVSPAQEQYPPGCQSFAPAWRCGPRCLGLITALEQRGRRLAIEHETLLHAVPSVAWPAARGAWRAR